MWATMGGYGSTRWNCHATRATTDELLALDVRTLARRGYFDVEPGEVATGIEAWSHSGREVGRIDVEYRGDAPLAMTFAYRAHRPGKEWRTIRERVELNRTPCTFGGGRPWFV